MQALLILLICLVTLAVLAGRYGVDSRDGLDWSPPDRARSRGHLWRAVLADLGADLCSRGVSPAEPPSVTIPRRRAATLAMNFDAGGGDASSELRA